MTKSFAWAALLPLLFACGPRDILDAQTAVAPAPAAATGPIDAVLDSVARTPPLHRTHWGVAVHDAVTGEVLVDRNADMLFIAASNMKLVTVAAALDLLGPDYRFRTELRAEGVRNGVAERLVVLGGGDPSFTTAFHPDPLAPLDSMADSLAAAGVRRIDGPVVIDQSRFGPALVHPAWELFDLDWYYAAPTAAFAVMRGAVEVVMRPGAEGRPAEVVLPHAAPLVAVSGDVRTAAGAGDWDDVLERVPGADSLVLGGEIGAGAGPDTSWIAQTDPGRLAGRALRLALGRAGIEVAGPVVVRYTADASTPAADAAAAPRAGNGTARVVWRSPALVDMIHLPLALTDNWVTEQILRTIGAELRGSGGWSAATAAVEAYMAERVGIEPGALYMRDGSGLTAQGLVTPAALARLLRYTRARPWGDAFRAALAVPGDPEGTLPDRLVEHGDRVAAKTGTLRHVNALSGYMVADDGRELVFSVLTMASGRPAREVRPAMDRVVDAIIRSGS